MKTHNIFLALLFLLAVGIGCDGDDGSTSPQVLAVACFGCPCDFRSVPLTEECWTRKEQDLKMHIIGNVFRVEFGCSLSNQEVGCFGSSTCPAALFAISGGNAAGACFHESTNPRCRPFLQSFDLTPAELEACGRCLEEYATELVERGFPVVGRTPFTCFPSD